jgi:hypothetical protein
MSMAIWSGQLFLVEDYGRVIRYHCICSSYVQKDCRHSSNGVKICRNAPIISHLLFADDCFPFFKATVTEANALKNILSVYESASGQANNLQKSKFYCSRNVPAEAREAIANQLDVTQVVKTGKYLGIPSMIGRSKKATFKFIKDRI